MEIQLDFLKIYNKSVFSDMLKFNQIQSKIIKIFLYQRKIEQSAKNIELGQIQNSGNTNQALNSSKKKGQGTITRNMPKSLSDLTTQFLCLMLNLVFVIVLLTMNQIEPKELKLVQKSGLEALRPLIHEHIRMHNSSRYALGIN